MRYILTLMMVIITTSTFCQQLTVKALRECLYPSFNVRNDVLHEKGFVYKGEENTIIEGNRTKKYWWVFTTGVTGELNFEEVNILITSVPLRDGTIKTVTVVKYFIDNLNHFENFRSDLIMSGYSCVNYAFNNNPNVQSYLFNNQQVLMTIIPRDSNFITVF